MSYKVTKVGAARPAAAEKENGFQTFEGLEVYKAARDLRKAMYGVTRRLPNFEKYEVASQIRRAAVSLTNNIAEGHGRFHYPDQIRFILHSRGSVEELIDDLNICLDEGYIPPDEVATLREKALGVLALLNGYLRYLRGRSSSIHEPHDSYSVSEDLLEGLPW
jgi:four helix bundle protein